MKATVEPLEGNKVKLSVEVDESEFDKAVELALRKVAREVRIPGFRPGKAPRRLLEARMGKAGVRQEAMREALPEYYAEALRQTEVDAIAPPKIDVTSGDAEGPLAFDAVVEVRPQVNLVGYHGLQVTLPSPTVSDDELRQQIDRLRRSSGELAVVTRPVADRDHVTIDVSGFEGSEAVPGLTAEDYLYEVGTRTIAPELDEHLIGVDAGTAVEFEAPVGDGRIISFKVLVKDVKEMVLPDLTDEWASEASEFETVAELEADLRRRMNEIKKNQANMALREEAVKALAELVDEDVPEPLVAAEMERRLQDMGRRLEAQGRTVHQYLETMGQSEAELIESLRATATSAVRADLALRALAESEGLVVTEEEIESELAGLAERLEQEPEVLRRQLEHVGQMPAVRSDIRKGKAIGWLIEHVEIVDDDGHPIDRTALEPEGPLAGDTEEASAAGPGGSERSIVEDAE